MGMMTIYHGGYQPVENPEIRKSRNTKDFGMGFYCTIIKEQAQRWARRYSTKIVSVYDVNMNFSLKIKEFKDMNPTHQIVFCTKEALKYLHYRGYEEVV